MAEVALLERAGVTVEDDGKAFLIRGNRFPFTSILHIEISKREQSGVAHGATWREQRVLARLITEDRMQDPLLIELGLRASSTDGEAPDLEITRLVMRARRVAEAAGRIAKKLVLEA